MATDDQNNYWAQNPDEQPAEEAQPVVTPEQQSSETPEQPPVQLPVAEDTPENPPITWTAQEYIHLDKNVGWFVLFALIVLALVATDIFFLKSWTFSALVIVMAVAIIIYVRRPPRTLTYALSPVQGLYVGERLYHYDDFRAFGLIQDGEHHSIMLIPRKRFAPGVSVYFPEEAGERIVDILGQRLPMENLKLDIVDVVVRKLRL
jgi:hypothetical protein